MGKLRDLRQGMSGPDVLAVQQGLNTALRWRGPHPLKVDGIFGPLTDAAVRKFQQEAGINVSGAVDSETRRALFPLAIANVHLFGMRLKSPTWALPGTQSTYRSRLRLVDPLRLNPGAGLNLDPTLLPSISHYQPQTFNPLTLPLAAPRFLSPPGTPDQFGLRLPIHHYELSPGGSLTLAPGTADAAFSLTLQAVVMLGDDDDPHQEIASGLALNADANGWSVAWYMQITDVDRFGKLGHFHWWGPYAQVSLDTKDFTPSLSLTPINLSLDVSDTVTVNLLNAGLLLTYDPDTGRMQAGANLSAGVVVKFGGP